jgi:hypothetical protein
LPVANINVPFAAFEIIIADSKIMIMWHVNENNNNMKWILNNPAFARNENEEVASMWKAVMIIIDQ